MKCLVLSGGGEKGISFLGVIKYLEEKKLLNNIETFIGTSAGSIVCSLISIGYTSTEIIYILSRISIPNIIPLENLNIDDFLTDYGFLEHAKLNKIMSILIEKKTEIVDITFDEHYKTYKKHLIISGSNIETAESIYFDFKTHPNMKIVDAVKISCSIPFLFKPITYNDYKFLDGAIFDNYPIEYAKKYYKSNDDILGVLINFKHTCSKINSIENFMNNMLKSLFIRIQRTNIITKNTIVLDFTKLLNEDDEETKIKNYIQIGYDNTALYFKKNPISTKVVKLNGLKYENIEYNG